MDTSPPLLPQTIALVDDDRNILTSVSIGLQAEGFATRVYSDGEAALKALLDNPPDLAVCDVKMPRMDGYELAARVRKNPEFAKLPMIMVTSRTGAKHRARAIELGVNDYLGKPYQEFEMLEAIQKLLGIELDTSKRNREHARV